MSNHTPGPWTVTNIGNGESEITANGPDRDDVAGICIVAGGLGSSIEDGIDHESVANARLIAAAPDMRLLLDECQEAIDNAVSQLCDVLEFEEGDDTDVHLESLGNLAMRCRQALAKASGLATA